MTVLVLRNIALNYKVQAVLEKSNVACVLRYDLVHVSACVCVRACLS